MRRLSDVCAFKYSVLSVSCYLLGNTVSLLLSISAANNRPHCDLLTYLCLKVVGPPGTGKTDVAVQIISNVYHNFPEQRTLIVTHSNQVNPTHNQTLCSESKLFLEFVACYIYVYLSCIKS